MQPLLFLAVYRSLRVIMGTLPHHYGSPGWLQRLFATVQHSGTTTHHEGVLLMAAQPTAIRNAVAQLLSAKSINLNVAPGTVLIFRSINDSHRSGLPSNSFRPCEVQARQTREINGTLRVAKPEKVYVRFADSEPGVDFGLDPSNLVEATDENWAASILAYQQGLLPLLKDKTDLRDRMFTAMAWLARMGAYAAQDAKLALAPIAPQRQMF